MDILILSDIHGNYPALEAIEKFFSKQHFDMIINCGDSLVYGPFPNETLSWLKTHADISILGNTDKKVLKLLSGKTFAKPSRPDKRIMYTWTAEQLKKNQLQFLRSIKKKELATLRAPPNERRGITILGVFHGSPARHHEFLFSATPDLRFQELVKSHPQFDIILCGHSHSPFHKKIGPAHFINPGSAGRMFDGDPRASCATLSITASGVSVQHYRLSYDIQSTVSAIKSYGLPEIYCEMYKIGKKLN